MLIEDWLDVEVLLVLIELEDDVDCEDEDFEVDEALL